MKIANPIYDSVFKHLMDNRDIARELISRLIGVPILSLEPQGQELNQLQAQVVTSDNSLVRIFRIDFAAEIRLTDGSTQKVLIELQKARGDDVVGRFRTYLAGHYGKAPKEAGHLPIIAIYMLGFTLSEDLPKVLKVKRRYLNGVTGNELTTVAKNSFIEQLTHDAVIVQIPKIDDSIETEIERALVLFNQHHTDGENRHLLVLQREQWDDPLVAAMLRTLLHVVSDEETRRQMGAEDEIEAVIMKREKAEADLQEALKEMEEERRQKEEAIKRAEEAIKRAEEAMKLVAEIQEKLRRLEGR